MSTAAKPWIVTKPAHGETVEAIPGRPGWVKITTPDGRVRVVRNEPGPDARPPGHETNR